jgi:hypothetical protein
MQYMATDRKKNRLKPETEMKGSVCSDGGRDGPHVDYVKEIGREESSKGLWHWLIHYTNL